MRKLGKATMAAVLSTAMIMGNIGGNVPLGWNMQQVKAADISYVELNEEFESSGEVYFKLPACGSVSFQDENGEDVERTVERVSEDGNLTEVAKTYYGAVRLGAGTYKVGDSSKIISKVVFTEESADSYEQEWNDTIDTANVIKTNCVYTGKLNYYSWNSNGYFHDTLDVDYYKLTLDNPGKVYLQYTVKDFGMNENRGCNYNTVTLYAEDEDGNISTVTQVGERNSENRTRYSGRYRLPKGNYYISISEGRYEGDSNVRPVNITEYQLKVNYTEESADKYEQEYNDTLDTANPISTNSTYTGNISEAKDVDYFAFTLDKKSNVKLKTSVPRQSTDKLFTFGIYKSNGTSKVAEVKSGTNPTAYTTEKELDPGTYYVIVKKGDAEEVESEVDYSINVMATEVQEIVATPAPTQEPEEDTDTDNEQTDEDTEETTAPGAVATRQPVTGDEDDKDVSEPGAVVTRAPAIATSVPTDEEKPSDEEEAENVTTEVPSITVVPDTGDKNETTVPTKTPASADVVTEAPGTVETPKSTVAPENTTNTPATSAPDKVSANPTVTATAAPTEEPDMIDELRMYADVDKDEELRVGDEFTVYAEAVPDELNGDLEVIWKSSNTKIATVSEEGEVTCKGAGTVTISVTTTDGSKITVSMKFTIKKALSKVNTLSKITFTQGKLTPNFTKAKTSYTLTLGKNMSSTTIRYKKTDSASTVKINGSSASKIKIKLKPGESKVVKITVTAENGSKKAYKIKVRRKR